MSAHQKMIILTPDDTVKTADYENYDSLHNAVDGLYEVFHEDKLPLDMIGKKPLDISFYCNEEFLIRSDEKFEKINAIASALAGQEIRGDVAVLVRTETPDGYDIRGFEYLEEEVGDGEIEEAICECWCAEDTFMLFASRNKEALCDLHKRLDNNKSEPHFEFTVFE